jgi:hypothetical protein
LEGTDRGLFKTLSPIFLEGRRNTTENSVRSDCILAEIRTWYLLIEMKEPYDLIPYFPLNKSVRKMVILLIS